MVKRVYLFLLQTVDFINVVLHNLQQARVAETVQAETGYGSKTAPDLMRSAGTRIEAMNAIANSPLYGRVVTGIKMQ